MSDVDFLKTNDTFYQDTYDLVLDSFKGSPNYIKIINVISGVMQDYEALIVDMATKMLFENATGEQLTEIGRQLDVPRTVEDDEEYRAVLALSALRRINDGTRDTLYTILSAYSAKDIEFITSADSQLDINLFAACLSGIHGADVILDLLPINTYYRVVDVEGSAFGWDDDDLGFGSTEDPEAGGNFASLMSSVE